MKGLMCNPVLIKRERKKMEINKIIGVISYKDLFREKREDWNSVRVKERMSTRLVCVSPRDGVFTAVEKMTKEGIGRLLVMDADALVGIVPRSSIMEIYFSLCLTFLAIILLTFERGK
jgi:CBS domain-containing protein